jgi:hypothetical protein
MSYLVFNVTWGTDNNMSIHRRVVDQRRNIKRLRDKTEPRDPW